MKPILSPVESLGLAGAAFDSRLRNAGRHVADTTLVRVAERLRADAFANDMIYEHENGREAVRIMLRPLIAHREQLAYVHHVCTQLTEALRRIPDFYLRDPDVRRLIRITDHEERWVRDIWTEAHSRNNPIYGRLDAVCDFGSAGWQDTFKFMEPNLSGVGGINYGPIAEQLVMRDVVPTLRAHDPDLVIELPRDQRDLFIQVMIDHARLVGRASCQLCFLEPRFEAGGPDEQSALIRDLGARLGLSIAHADPRELTVRDGEVYCGDMRIDVAYRDYELRDIIALETELGRPLDGMRLLLRENRVVSSLAGDFDHKSGFELLTDPVLAERYFSPEDCRLFRRHVLWTRLFADRETSLADGSSGNLVEHARLHREQLVLKPNRAYGGDGVTIGAATEPAAWEELLTRVARDGDDPQASWVLQAATPLPVAEFPVIGEDGRVFSEPFYAVMGFAPTDNGLGVMCRVSQKQVVNIAQHGGMAAVLVGETPTDLRIPRRPHKAMEDVKGALRRRMAELRHLDQAIGLLEWDEETKLPDNGRADRGEQVATLEGLRHGLLTADQLGDLIEEAALQYEGDRDAERELFLLRRERHRAMAIPEEIVRALAGTKSLALAAWEEARDANDYRIFAAPFTQLLQVVRERAQCLSSGTDPYDALLDENEPGMTRSRLDPVLTDLCATLAPLVERAARSAVRKGEPGVFPATPQWELSSRVLKAIGFDFSRGRLDPSTHPFTMQAGMDDVRVTSRVDEADLSSGLLATLHEGGHALYDQGFRAADRETLLADGASSALHEGMARLWENHVGRSRAFVDWLMPHLGELFPAAPSLRDADTVWRQVNAVRPGVIRVGADEMTYHLHIALRHELEAALLSGSLAVADLPGAWNTRAAALIGVKPRSDLEGVLQDVHWASGMFGYFPTYTIGSLYAAQLVETYSASNDLERRIRSGDFASLRNWLARNVYEIGNRLPAEEIIVNATGKGLDSAAYFAHVTSQSRAWN